MGILSRRRTQRVDPPSFGLGGGAAAPFSLDAALKGTIPSYSGSSSGGGGGSRARNNSNNSLLDSSSSSSSLFPQSDMNSSWFFDIHEDTPEQEMTNLLNHSTCTLDISSDEESEQRMRRECDEGRDKENVPPPDDVSQTSSAIRGARACDFDDMVIDKPRGPLAEMNVADYFGEGCDYDSVILVHDDDEDEAETVVDETCAQLALVPLPVVHEEDQEGEPDDETVRPSHARVDAIMGKEDSPLKAALLEPMEGTGDSFVLWESASAKDENSVPASPLPIAEEEVQL